MNSLDAGGRGWRWFMHSSLCRFLHPTLYGFYWFFNAHLNGIFSLFIFILEDFTNSAVSALLPQGMACKTNECAALICPFYWKPDFWAASNCSSPRDFCSPLHFLAFLDVSSPPEKNNAFKCTILHLFHLALHPAVGAERPDAVLQSIHVRLHSNTLCKPM